VLRDVWLLGNDVFVTSLTLHRSERSASDLRQWPMTSSVRSGQVTGPRSALDIVQLPLRRIFNCRIDYGRNRVDGVRPSSLESVKQLEGMIPWRGFANASEMISTRSMCTQEMKWAISSRGPDVSISDPLCHWRMATLPLTRCRTQKVYE
jgi:hypothetical protein